ncbi:uncharacterized protein BCR38DRAFT_403002, partial [Pseudomassariella vexata]
MVTDIDLSVRLKYGIHSIFLLVDPTSTFGAVASELLEILQERYPDGLTTQDSKTKTALPSDSSLIEFAVLKSPTDPLQGWKSLKAKGNDTWVGKGVKDGMMVAFAFRDEDEEEMGEVVFVVDFPSYDDEMEEPEAED